MSFKNFGSLIYSQTMKHLAQTITLTAIFLIATSNVYAQTPTKIRTYHDWTAYRSADTNGRVCFMSAKPKLAQGNYTRRGPVFAFITHRKSSRSHDVMSVVAGYEYQENSQVTVTIDKNKTFTLFTHGDTAWGRDATTDRKLVNAIRNGNKMIITGTSKRGTATIDTYSLRGSGSAYNAITKSCR